MKNRVLISTLGAGLAALALPLGSAFAQVPEPPARFAGSVTVNGTPAPQGTQVEARVGSASCGTASTTTNAGEGRYVVDVLAASQQAGCGTDGATVTFFVGGVQAGTGTWHNYQLNTANLATTAATATPTATQTATATATTTVVPTAPQTGSGLESEGGTSGTLALVGGAIVLAAGATAAAATARRRN